MYEFLELAAYKIHDGPHTNRVRSIGVSLKEETHCSDDSFRIIFNFAGSTQCVQIAQGHKTPIECHTSSAFKRASPFTPETCSHNVLNSIASMVTRYFRLTPGHFVSPCHSWYDEKIAKRIFDVPLFRNHGSPHSHQCDEGQVEVDFLCDRLAIMMEELQEMRRLVSQRVSTAQEAKRMAQEAEQRVQEAEQRAQEAEQMAQEAEQRAQEAVALRSAGVCVVCLNQDATVACLPCGHLCLCAGCMDEVCRRGQPCCPLCKAAIADRARIFSA